MLALEADETVNQGKLTYLQKHIAALEEGYVMLYQTSKELTITGKNRMTDATKHTSDVGEPQMARHKQLRDYHDVPTIEGNAKEKIAAFREEINKLKATYRAAKVILSQTGGIDTSNSINNPFPTTSGAFGAHTSGRRVAFNTTFNDSSESIGGSDEFDKTSAYADTFFKKGGIDQILAEATASAKPLKITGRVIDKFNGDITHWTQFREQFVKLAYRAGNFSDDIKRFYFRKPWARAGWGDDRGRDPNPRVPGPHSTARGLAYWRDVQAK